MDTYIDRIKYNYYPIECTNSRNIKRKNPKIITTYQGKINQPNIIYANKYKETTYQATELFVYGKIHDIYSTNKNIQDGEIVILHHPITSDIKLYCCFPFIYNNHCIDAEIDAIIISSKITSK